MEAGLRQAVPALPTYSPLGAQEAYLNVLIIKPLHLKGDPHSLNEGTV